jgi:DNA-directed RNA polymerase omega subunit
MEDTNELVEQPQEGVPLIPAEPAPPIESRFLFVDVAALRAKQLRRGARLRFEDQVASTLHKPERMAMEEVRRGLVQYQVPELRAGRSDGGA